MAHAIKNGDKGGEVNALQAKLEKLGFALNADGIFGPRTKEAVEELQSLFGYDVDGMVGDATHKLIESQIGYGFRLDLPDAVKRALEAQGKKDADGHLAGAELTQILKPGSQGVPVRYLQRRLNALGFQVALDGQFGANTEQAVRKLQQSFGYDVDGKVGPATHKLINAQIGYGWNVSKAAAQPKS